MANRRTIGAVILNDSTLAPNELSPLRRKSMAIAALPLTPTAIAENDDEREKQARRRQSRMFDSPARSDNSSRRMSIAPPEGLSGNALTEHYQKCMRLCAEGKITVKNAFSLSVIDYIGVLNKNDKTTNSMQTAQATLDISAKIYGLRVDCVHSDVLKMAGNPVKQTNRNPQDPDAEPNPDSSVCDGAEKKKRRRKAQKILVSHESLTAPAETLNLRSTIKNSESQTSDMLLQVTYPVLVSSGHSLYLYEDMSLEFPEDAPERGDNFSEFEIDALPDFSNKNICPPLLQDWRILGWSEADIPESPPRPNFLMNENFRFDINNAIPEEDNNAYEYGFDDDDESQVNVDRCNRRPEQAERIVDFQKSIMENNTEKNLEYSYVPGANSNVHWAGPDHWKPACFPRLSNKNRSIEVGACGQQKRRGKKHQDVVLTGDELENNIMIKLQKKVKNLRIQTVKHSWSDNHHLPEDVHVQSDQQMSYYYDMFKKSRLYSRPAGGEDHNATVIEDVGYDYNNDNDTQEYCSQGAEPDPEPEEMENGENPSADENVDPEGEVATQAFTGDNLVDAPKATQKISIQYATRAKKIDMKQLKDGMWKSLNFLEHREGADDDQGDRNFSQTYKKLENVLGSEKSRALSIGLAFSSLLHLANEKNLSIQTTDGFTDLQVTQDHRD